MEVRRLHVRLDGDKLTAFPVSGNFRWQVSALASATSLPFAYLVHLFVQLSLLFPTTSKVVYDS